MPYTLMKGLAWVLLAVVIGIVVGWLLRSVAAKRQIERAKQGRVDDAEVDELRQLRDRVIELEAVAADRDRLRAELDRADRPPPPQRPDALAGAPASDRIAEPEPGANGRLAEASAVIGRTVELDDLTVIDGIGPQIADLCHGIGIRSWADLATTEVSLLRTMLQDAGQRLKVHDPSSWPQQAALLAAGSWTEFRVLTEQLDSARPAD